MFKHLISAVLIVFAALPVCAKIYGETEIHLNSATALYFDQKQLQELIDSGAQESVEVLAQKINDFFTSTPLTIQGDGQFFMQDWDGKKQYVTLNPRQPHHEHYIFVIRVNPNQNFARAYVLALAKMAEELFKALETTVELGMSVNAAQVQYANFYTCLENVAIMNDPKILGCLDAAIRQIGFKNPADALYLANVYMKMYRMGRLSFGSTSSVEKIIMTKDKRHSFKSKDYTRFYQPIILDDPELVSACKVMMTNFRKIMYVKDSMMRTELPTWGWSAIKWQHFGGKEEAQKKVKLSYAIPTLSNLIGPYFDSVRRAGDYVSDRHEDQEKLCKEYDMMRGTW